MHSSGQWSRSRTIYYLAPSCRILLSIMLPSYLSSSRVQLSSIARKMRSWSRRNWGEIQGWKNKPFMLFLTPSNWLVVPPQTSNYFDSFYASHYFIWKRRGGYFKSKQVNLTTTQSQDFVVSQVQRRSSMHYIPSYPKWFFTYLKVSTGCKAYDGNVSTVAKFGYSCFSEGLTRHDEKPPALSARSWHWYHASLSV